MTTEEKQELNRRVSELRERKPGDWNTTYPSVEEFSANGSWCIEKLRVSGGRWEHIHTPRDWTGDEAANAVLLEEMPRAALEKDHPAYNHLGLWTCWPFGEHYPHARIDDDRKVAVVKAWLAWRGLRP